MKTSDLLLIGAAVGGYMIYTGVRKEVAFINQRILTSEQALYDIVNAPSNLFDSFVGSISSAFSGFGGGGGR